MSPTLSDSHEELKGRFAAERLNQSRQEGLKTDNPFSACPLPSLPPALTHAQAFTPDNGRYLPSEDKTKKEREREPGQWQKKRY